MSIQTLHQGGLRPATIPAITVVHPGLQVHSIAAPKTDRRLSFLMSANLYCAFAAGVVLMAQASPAFIKPIIKADPPTVVFDLRPPETTPKPMAVIAPNPPNNSQSNSATTPTITEHPPIGVPDTPTSVGTHNLADQIALNPASDIGRGPWTGTTPTDGPTDTPAGPPIEVSSSAVSILHQIQPIYPTLARLAHKEGDVVLIMTINELGVPTDVKMDSGDTVFRNDAIRAAQQWRFTSARFDGQPHSARFRLTLQFRLRG